MFGVPVVWCAIQEHAAIKELDELYSAFPKNPDLLVRKAQAQLQVMDPEQARQTLQAAHAADTLSLEGMDTLAYLLKKKYATLAWRAIGRLLSTQRCGSCFGVGAGPQIWSSWCDTASA